MNELREIFESEFDVLLEKSQLPKYALGKLKYNFVMGDKKNLNHRIYSEDILVREITKKKLELENSKIIGSLDHPVDGISKLRDSMHLLGDISYDKELKVGVAESYILNTRAGRDFLTLLDTGINLGPSMRGYGNVDPSGNVKNDYKLETIDFVLKPSFGQDVVVDKTNLIESANSLFEPKKEDNKMGSKSKERILNTIYYRDINNGTFQGSLEDYKLKNEKFVDIAILETEGNLTYPEAVKKVLGETEGQKILNKENKIREKVEVKDIIFEARIAGINPSEYVKKLNAEVDRQNQKILSENAEQIGYILREAASAGMNTSDPDVRKKILENFENLKSESGIEPTKKQKLIEKIIKAKEDEAQKYDFLAGERIAAGWKGKK